MILCKHCDHQITFYDGKWRDSLPILPSLNFLCVYDPNKAHKVGQQHEPEAAPFINEDAPCWPKD